jgi:hypothetical protein
LKNNQFTVYGNRSCQFFWAVHGRRGEVEVEPLKSETVVRGQGPYKSILSTFEKGGAKSSEGATASEATASEATASEATASEATESTS